MAHGYGCIHEHRKNAAAQAKYMSDREKKNKAVDHKASKMKKWENSWQENKNRKLQIELTFDHIESEIKNNNLEKIKVYKVITDQTKLLEGGPEYYSDQPDDSVLDMFGVRSSKNKNRTAKQKIQKRSRRKNNVVSTSASFGNIRNPATSEENQANTFPLYNRRNDCFLNAPLQVLFRIPSFANLLESDRINNKKFNPPSHRTLSKKKVRSTNDSYNSMRVAYCL